MAGASSVGAEAKTGQYVYVNGGFLREPWPERFVVLASCSRGAGELLWRFTGEQNGFAIRTTDGDMCGELLSPPPHAGVIFEDARRVLPPSREVARGRPVYRFQRALTEDERDMALDEVKRTYDDEEIEDLPPGGFPVDKGGCVGGPLAAHGGELWVLSEPTARKQFGEFLTGVGGLLGVGDVGPVFVKGTCCWGAKPLRTKMQIFVQTLSGKTIVLDVERSDTVHKVKTMIQETQPVHFDHQRLSFGGKLLLDYYTMEDHDIDDGAMVDLTIVK